MPLQNNEQKRKQDNTLTGRVIPVLFVATKKKRHRRSCQSDNQPVSVGKHASWMYLHESHDWNKNFHEPISMNAI